MKNATTKEKKSFKTISSFSIIDIVQFSRLVVGITVLSLQMKGKKKASTDLIRKEMTDLDFPNWNCFVNLHIVSRGGSHWCMERKYPHLVVHALTMYSDRMHRHLVHNGCIQITKRYNQDRAELPVGENCTWNIRQPILLEELLNVKFKM